MLYLLMKPELEGTEWMKDIAQKFTKPRNPVVDARAGTFLSPKLVWFSSSVESLLDAKLI